MKSNLNVSLDALSKVFDECLKDDLLKVALKHFDDQQIKDLKDLVIPNLVDYAMYNGEVRSLTSVSVYRHTRPIVYGEIQDCAIVLFRITRRRKYASSKPLYFVVVMSDFKIVKSTNLTLQNASSFYTLLVEGLRVKSIDTHPELPF